MAYKVKYYAKADTPECGGDKTVSRVPAPLFKSQKLAESWSVVVS